MFNPKVGETYLFKLYSKHIPHLYQVYEMKVNDIKEGHVDFKYKIIASNREQADGIGDTGEAYILIHKIDEWIDEGKWVEVDRNKVKLPEELFNV